MRENEKFEDFVNGIASRSDISDEAKQHIFLQMQKLKDTKVNILITGATGCGKSSTINALFNTDKAKVGQGTDPETMEIEQYEMDNVVLWDSPGLGDGKAADTRHSKNIIDKLLETDKSGNALIDLVLVILDGSSRDLGTSYQLINQVIIPNLGEDKSRLLVAINQCDVAMKGRYWDSQENKPEPRLTEFLDEKVRSTQRRIKEATGVNVDIIYYSAGYKDGADQQNPFNLSKLLLFILNHTKIEKRAVIANDMNANPEMWKDDDDLQDYSKEIKETLWESITSGVATGGKIGAEIGSLFGASGKVIGSAIGSALGGVCGLVRGFFGW